MAGALALAAWACARHDPGDILLFAGTGTSSGDVRAIERLLRREGLAYSTADSSALDVMGRAGFGGYRLLIIPGGNFEIMGNSLSAATSSAIRECVQAGLNYLGLCAGAFFAGASPYSGADLLGGVRFGFYGLETRGVRKAAVPISTPGAAPVEQYWENGPRLAGWGEPIALYPDGSPAIVQGRVGRGWVLLSGVHPEAEEGWRGGLGFRTTPNAANAYAIQLIDAAREGRRLPHF